MDFQELNKLALKIKNYVSSNLILLDTCYFVHILIFYIFIECINNKY